MRNNLKERIDQYKTLSLPGQPQCCHMGTNYLINDLWREILRLRTAMSDKDKVLMPRELTAENGAKSLLRGEFKEEREEECTYCDGSGIDLYDDSDCVDCGGAGSFTNSIDVSWSNIKAIYKKAVKALGEKYEY